MAVNNRIFKWDNLKALLIFCVVFGHLMKSFDEEHLIVQNIIFFVYVFHMPAFVFVTGLFSKNAVKNKNYDRVFKFVMIFIVIKLMLSLTNLILLDTPEFKPDDFKAFEMFSSSDVSWYGIVIAMCLLLTMLLDRYSPTFVLILAFILGCAYGYCSDVEYLFAMNRMFYFYPFFLMGYYLKTDTIIELTRPWYIKVVAAFSLVMTYRICSFNIEKWYPNIKFIKGILKYKKLEDLVLQAGLIRLFVYAVATVLIFAIISLIPSCKIPVVSYVGRNTLPIYLFHKIINALLDNKDWLVTAINENFQTEQQGVLVYVFISLAIVLVLSLPPFAFVAEKITSPSLRNKQIISK